MDNIMTFWEYLSTAVSLPKLTTYFLEIILTEENNQSKVFASYFATKLSTLKTFSY